MTSITPTFAQQMLTKGEAILLDVREPAEYKAEYIKGSILLPLAKCRANALPPLNGKTLIVHCQAGKRGQQACAKLASLGQPLYNLEGGLDAWKKAGLPVEKGSTLPLIRQVHITVGSLIIALTTLGFIHHPYWHMGAGLMGLGLLNAGATGWCGMAMVLSKMPWNRS